MKNKKVDSNDSLIGDHDAARIRFLRFAELAAKELDAVQLNALSIAISCRLIPHLGDHGTRLLMRISEDLKGERVENWTLRYQGIAWGKA